MKSPLALLVLATALAGAAQAATTPADGPQQALQTTMGDKAQNLTVEVSNGVAQLKGWAQQPSDVEQARYIVSKAPGITQAYSAQVRTWSTTNR